MLEQPAVHPVQAISGREGKMAERLSGKRAIVTAAGQGIGRAIAAAFAREVASVFAFDIEIGRASRRERV